MFMAAARWDVLAAQMSWIMSEPGKNPFVIEKETAGKVVTISPSEFIRGFYGKAVE